MHIQIIALETKITTVNSEILELSKQIDSKQKEKQDIMALQKAANESIADLEKSLRKVQDAIALLGDYGIELHEVATAKVKEYLFDIKIQETQQSEAKQLTAPTPVVQEAAITISEPTQVDIVPDEWEELSAIARYNHSQEKLYIKFNSEGISESWFSYLHGIKAITEDFHKSRKQKDSYYSIFQLPFVSAKALVDKYDFNVLSPNDKDTSYFDNKTLYIGVNNKNKAQNFIAQIRKTCNLPSTLKVNKSVMLTHYKYEISGTVTFEKEVELLRSLDWSKDITDEYNSELLEPYKKEDVEIIETDFNSISSEIEINMKTLGWDKEKGKQYLINTYGKKSRLQLTDDELIQFSNELKNLIDSHQSVA